MILRIILLIGILILNSRITEAKSISDKTQNDLSLINRNLERLEMNMRQNNYGDGCIEAVKTAELIKEEIISLQKIEPDYDWLEIREVLIDLPSKYCSNGSKGEN